MPRGKLWQKLYDRWWNHEKQSMHSSLSTGWQNRLRWEMSNWWFLCIDVVEMDIVDHSNVFGGIWLSLTAHISDWMDALREKSTTAHSTIHVRYHHLLYIFANESDLVNIEGTCTIKMNTEIYLCTPNDSYRDYLSGYVPEWGAYCTFIPISIFVCVPLHV